MLKTYYVWVTLLSHAYVEQLVGRLIHLGYEVGPITRQNNQLVIRSDDAPSAIFGARVTFKFDNVEHATTSNLLATMQDILQSLKIKYHSLIISEEVTSSWCLGNISIKEITGQIKSDDLQSAAEALQKSF